eukprot:TRINITY_DN22116_c0_g1_i2.p1 TRINITY_DN22116_c0_g1~~TRINITY_DN22116_c0_g1_i2.p1  ORF type:complete len:176 (-),score=20.94 TRINITY_DN22116_c0_g1_i2:7-534(-)
MLRSLVGSEMCIRDRCGHGLKRHKATSKSKFGCSEPGCSCSCYQFHVQDNAWQARCGCKHKHTDHGASRPHRCHKQGCKCQEYCCSWKCHCGEPWTAHETIFTLSGWARGGRQWVTQGLRKETAQLARGYRARPEEQRQAAARLNATAKANGFRSTKEMKRKLEAEQNAQPPMVF